jgi:hypothetical protein
MHIIIALLDFVNHVALLALYFILCDSVDTFRSKTVFMYLVQAQYAFNAALL